jgi:hypothetical protein
MSAETIRWIQGPTTNFNFRLAAPQVTSTIMDLPVTPFRTLDVQTFHAGVKEMLGYVAGGKKAVVRITNNSILGANKADQVHRWDFHVTEPKAYVSFARGTGRIQINTTQAPEVVLRFLDRTYFPGISSLPYRILKIDTKIYIDRTLNLDNLAQEIGSKVPGSVASVRYEPELMPGLYLKWAKPHVNLIMYTNGTILTQGLKSLESIGLTGQILESLFREHKVDHLKVFKYLRGTNKKNWLPKLHAPVPQRKNKEGKRAHMLDARYPLAQGYTDERAGFYVRPGPDKKPRFYPLVGDLALVRTKVARAYANAGVEIPSPVRNALGIERGAAPKNKAEGRRAPSWNAQKNGYYVKPGPGGQPYFFKVPKHKAYALPKVIERYQKAGRRIPTPVRAIFGLTRSPELQHLQAQLAVNTNAQGHLRINGKHFNKYTRAELLAIARDLNIANVGNNSSLSNIAQRILNVKGRERQRADLVMEGRPVVFMANGRVKRGDRARQWTTLNASEKNSIARGYLTDAEYKEWQELSAGDKYDALLYFKNKRAAVKPKTPSPPSSAASSVASPTFELELEASLLVSGVGGTKNDEEKLVKIFKNLPRGARGKPLKADMARASKNFIKEIKRRVQLKKIREAYKARIVVPNWIPANKRNAFSQTLLNLATAPNAKGKLPTRAAVRRGLSAWLRSQLPQQALAARNVENVATGIVRRVPAWNPNVIKTPNFPSPNVKRLGTPRRKAQAPAAPKKDPRENKEYALPKTENVENLANAMIGLGLRVGATNKYSWTQLKNAGVPEKFKNTWLKNVAGLNAPNALSALKTAKARANWLAVHKPLLNKEAYQALKKHKLVLNQLNKNRRAAAKAAR